ncbi:3-hydroxyacyl-CoA dehydrogenase family protein [Vulgatibacter incomptus]|uniref:3-hydroxybutyryl-CoA dehydrogenase n=1 Tax=Vulgatibacter incomptus TaxID=1391653 RepID=A0A0K1PAD6_9BACT|nr:3-hydroxyacyl-CoA dehydrogenase family protein [Vulgatibacter incomptus]AKU90079.1 3-hydroxybutyryl-CoA dehydrogenase [Vulgatibacter incomptus]
MNEIKTVAVLGAGTMGAGIAQVAAAAGWRTLLFDVTAERVEAGLGRIRDTLEKGVEKGKVAKADADGTLSRLHGITSLDQAADVGLVIEAVPEDLSLKVKVLGEAAKHVAKDAILASNTSSLCLTELAAALPGPARVVGMHFFNPVPRMKLLEVVRAHQTSDETLEVVREVGTQMGKEVIVVRDMPGFASSRLGIALGMEAIRMLEEGVATAPEIDAAMKLGYGHPMGPLELTDLVGLDVRMAIGEYLHRELGGEQFRPPQLLKRLVRAGKLGRKSGEGFYKY